MPILVQIYLLYASFLVCMRYESIYIICDSYIMVSEVVIILHIIRHNSIHQSHSLALSKWLLRNSQYIRKLGMWCVLLLKPNKTHLHYYNKCN